jgi:hypothetical protein
MNHSQIVAVRARPQLSEEEIVSERITSPLAGQIRWVHV